MKPTPEQLVAVVGALSCRHRRPPADPCSYCLNDAYAAWEVIVPLVLERASEAVDGACCHCGDLCAWKAVDELNE